MWILQILSIFLLYVVGNTMAMWAGIIFYRSRDTAKKTPNNAVVLILLHLRPFLALIIIIIIITIYKAHNVRKNWIWGAGSR